MLEGQWYIIFADRICHECYDVSIYGDCHFGDALMAAFKETL